MPEDNLVIEESQTVLMNRIVELEKVNKMYREELVGLRVLEGLMRQMRREARSGGIEGSTLGKINNLLGVEG